jgi:hypothetical protein
MKCLSLILFLSVVTGNGYAQTSGFYERVLGHLDCRYCYFLVVNINSPGFDGKVVVENDALFAYLTTAGGVAKSDYKNVMLDYLRENRALTIKDAKPNGDKAYLIGKGIDKYQFRILEPSQIFEDNSSKGCVSLVRHYFSPSLGDQFDNQEKNCKKVIKTNGKDLFFRPSAGMSEENNVIAKLFELEIPTHIDDISGSLIISHFTVR